MIITILSTAIVFACVLALCFGASWHVKELEGMFKVWDAVLSGPRAETNAKGLADLVKRANDSVSHLGGAGVGEADRQQVIGVHRAHAEVLRARVTTLIELMPQLGLLGTVAGLVYTMFWKDDTSIDGIGTALWTTVVGLVGLMGARFFVERRADEAYLNLIRLLDDPRFAAPERDKGSP